MNQPSLFSELQRRNVSRVGIAYLVTAWLIAQIGDVVLDSFDAPDWIMRSLLIALAIGFPAALLLAWVFDITPDGIQRDPADTAEGKAVEPTPKNRRNARILNRFTIVSLVLAPEPCLGPLSRRSRVYGAGGYLTGVAESTKNSSRPGESKTPE